ncbi:MAG: amidohydrolase family protein [Alphaproteobacteria bacterium]|nr:amidohydrolase family protein [Alphaproteobacteria bacterium]
MPAKPPAHTIIRNARLADPGTLRGDAVDILVEGDTIRSVGAPGLAAPADAAVVDAADCLLHPGLINAHTHGHGNLSRGQGDRWTLELLLAAAPWIGGNRAIEDKRLTTLIGAAEMLLKGCTAAYDLYYEFPTPSVDGLDAVAGAYAEAGMRAVVAPMVADLTLYEAIPGLMDALPAALQKEVARLRLAPWQTSLANIEASLKAWKWSSAGVRPAVAPTIPLHCCDEFMCGCARLAREHGAPLHTHVGESKVQAIAGINRYGRTLVAHMDKLGLIGPDFTAGHAIWLDDEDMRRMAAHGASAAHNPGSNMRLGNGLFNFRRMLDLGVNVGLGTDAASCGDNLNMYESMRLASMVSKTQGPDPRKWVTVQESYRAATEGSARALGFKDIGRIAPGFKADIVFLDLNAVNWIPWNNTINQLVHVEDGTSVRHVMAGGRMVVKEKRLTTLDLRSLARQAEAARERLEALNAEWKDLFIKLEPVVSSFCPALAKQPYHIRRYLDDDVRF